MSFVVTDGYCIVGPNVTGGSPKRACCDTFGSEQRTVLPWRTAILLDFSPAVLYTT